MVLESIFEKDYMRLYDQMLDWCDLGDKLVAVICLKLPDFKPSQRRQRAILPPASV